MSRRSLISRADAAGRAQRRGTLGARMWSEAPIRPPVAAIAAAAEEEPALSPVAPTDYDLVQSTYTGDGHTPGANTWTFKVKRLYLHSLVVGFVVANGPVSAPSGTTVIGSGSGDGLYWAAFWYVSPADYSPDLAGACDPSVTELYALRIRLDRFDGSDSVPTTMRPVVRASWESVGESTTVPTHPAGMSSPWLMAGSLGAVRADLTGAPAQFAWRWWDTLNSGSGGYLIGTGVPLGGSLPAAGSALTISGDTTRVWAAAILTLEGGTP